MNSVAPLLILPRSTSGSQRQPADCNSESHAAIQYLYILRQTHVAVRPSVSIALEAPTTSSDIRRYEFSRRKRKPEVNLLDSSLAFVDVDLDSQALRNL